MIPIPRTRRRHNEMDIAPLIDVVFLLLIFFTLTSSFAVPAAVDLTLPNGGKTKQPPVKFLSVSIRANGQIFVNSEPVPIESLYNRVTAVLSKNSNCPVRLEMDQALSVQKMVIVLDLLKSAGVANIDLATENGK